MTYRTGLLTYQSAAQKLGRTIDHARAIAQVCDLLDAAAALAKVPLLALVAVRVSSGEINPKAWVKDAPAGVKEAIVNCSLGHTFTEDDFTAIENSLNELKDYGNRAAWVEVKRRIPGDQLFKQLSSQSANAEGWSKEELLASVEAYVEMQRKERGGQPFTKKRYYENLAATFGRTEKAFEYRMQNISYVLSLMGRDWLPGLKPAKNVGSRTAAIIEALITQVEGRKSIPVAEFEIKVQEESQKPHLPRPKGNRSPQATSSEVTQFLRDASVKAWVLRQANGKCECCEMAAPFNGSNGIPYLEVHHVLQLADNGSDTVSNAIALCPNCHRELHYGANSKNLVAHLYEHVSRLVREQPN
jgi:5-methylcytosine-specific restriction protein A